MQFVLSVESRVIHKNGVTARYNRQQIVFKPVFEKSPIHSAFISLRSKSFFFAISRNYVCTRISSASFGVFDLDTAQSAAMRSSVVLVTTAFINVNTLIIRDFFQIL
jgi:hypothetical protein